MLPSRWTARVGTVLELDRVRAFRAVLARFDASGGSLLAGGLAYSALFAIVPLALLAAGLVGLLVSDHVVRDDVVRTIADVLPPLRGLLSLILAEAAESAPTISIAGAVALVWGGSRFLLAFEDAMSRVTGGPRTRGVLRRNALGIGAAIVLVTAVLLGVLVAGVAEFLDAAADQHAPVVISIAASLALALLPLGLALGAMALVFRFIPDRRPSWRATSSPALVVALAVTAVARIFVFIAPRLIGAAATIGTIATAFAALAWLGLTFQAILLGAAWVGERQERERTAGVATGPAG